MKQIGYTLLLLLFACGFANAQPMRGEKARENIKAIKVGYITDKLNLTPEQAAKFWPVYNKYEEELKSTRRSLIQKHAGSQNMTREEAMKFIDDNLDYQEAELTLKRKYNDEFLKIISAQQLAALYKADREFKTMMLNQMRKRNAQRGNRPMMQQK